MVRARTNNTSELQVLLKAHSAFVTAHAKLASAQQRFDEACRAGRVSAGDQRAMQMLVAAINGNTPASIPEGEPIEIGETDA